VSTEGLPPTFPGSPPTPPPPTGRESIGELYDRLPKDVWVNLPEYGIRVKAIANPPQAPPT
jgi:hypothetical protein